MEFIIIVLTKHKMLYVQIHISRLQIKKWRKCTMSKRFWNWVKNEDTRTLYLDGAIAEESWLGDGATRS